MTTDFYQVWEDAELGSNLWQVAFQILDFGRMIAYFAAMVTQVMVLIGLYSDINQAVWKWGVLVGGVVLDVFFQFFMATSLSRAVKEDKPAVILALTNEWKHWAAGNAFTMTFMAIGYDSWMASHYKLTG